MKICILLICLLTITSAQTFAQHDTCTFEQQLVEAFKPNSTHKKGYLSLRYDDTENEIIDATNLESLADSGNIMVNTILNSA